MIFDVGRLFTLNIKLPLFTIPLKKRDFAFQFITLWCSIFYLLFTIFSSSAQQSDPVSQTIRGGVILGMNASQVDGDDYSGFHKVGLNGGFYAQFPIAKKFFISTEILYSQQGGKSEVIQGIPLRYRSTLTYAQIPLLIHFQEKEAVNFGIGFTYGRLLSQKTFADEIEQPKAATCSGPPNDVSNLAPQFLCFKRNDFMAVADGNYLFNKNFMINIRYSYSIVPLGYYGSSNFRNRGLYNNVLTFRVMYVFGG